MLKLLFFFISSIAFALPEHTLSYELSRSGITLGTETRILSKKDDIYTYTAQAQTEGFARWLLDYSIRANTQFKLAQRLQNRTFSLVEKEDGKVKKNVALTFNDTQVYSKSKLWEQEGLPLVDTLSVFLALTHDLEHNNDLEYFIADGDSLDYYHFTRLGTSTMEVLGNDTEVIKITDNKGLVAYFAPKYHYLPVLIQKKKWQYKLKTLQLK